VSIRDSGVGIAVRLLPHVFDLFTQGKELPPGRGQTGLGVGLSLVRTLVEGHGGRVEAYSEGPGKGTEFVVRLPIAAEEATAGQALQGSTKMNLAGHAILVVDDNHDAADSLAALLTMYGGDVEVVYSGADALTAIARRMPTLLFIDIGMPEMDGLDLARHIRATTAGETVPLIAVTGWGQEHDRQAALAAGFNHHLTKPPDTARIEAVLKAINSRRPGR
jgi:CheY-like chemotaxis protein